jgi:hypothetical protein
VKLNVAGTVQWENMLDGGDYYVDYSVKQVSDEGYIIVGAMVPDAWIGRLNSSGNFQWEYFLGGSDYDYAQSVDQTSDGGYIISGYSFSSDGDLSHNNGSLPIIG